MPTFVAMQTRSWTTLVAVALLLSGCTATEPPENHPTSDPPAPDQATREQVLSALESYIRVSDGVYQAGGSSVDELTPLVTPDQLERERRVAAAFAQAEVHQVGSNQITHVSLQAQDAGSVHAYLCLDGSNSDVVDAHGNSAVKEGTPERQSFVANLEKGDGKLLMDGMEPWSGNSVC
ncbi:hypothetical protein QT381_08370 [Galbitalea sp. SE-J8]|uniref:hypothetical protein n=1 Tax=Galbitalea sp. SE-J8 TaxID=3054952 RepID=UPI00259CB9B5|nr:hypothetical protein [Galbitalea sp. SE-J8]MDM4763021.1 hypothetical protein [Galbitalea sp. SE-J8]